MRPSGSAKLQAGSAGGNAPSKGGADVKRVTVDHDVRGAELAALSKDDRKASKASDPVRAARRIEKKKARNELSRQQNRDGGQDARSKGILGKKRAGAKQHKPTGGHHDKPSAAKRKAKQ